METKPTDSKNTRSKISWSDIFSKLQKFNEEYEDKHIKKVYGIPKNGMILTAFLSRARFAPVNQLSFADIILDDIVASGRTRDRYMGMARPDAVFYSLYNTKDNPGIYLEFPWEDTKADSTDLIARQLEFIGEDVERDGLLNTPERVVKSWDEIYKGYSDDVKLKSFESFGTDEMIILKDINFYSMCEHHMLPFFGKVHVGYIPSNISAVIPVNTYRVAGVSKLIRLVEKYSRRLQIQEQLTMQIARELMDGIDALGVGVVIEAQHLCMMMRGVRSQNSIMTTSALLGIFRDEEGVRTEFLGRLGI